MRQKLLNLGPSELRNPRTLRPGGSTIRTNRNKTRFVLAKVKSQSRRSSGEWRLERKFANPTIRNERSRNLPLPSSYNSIQSVI